MYRSPVAENFDATTEKEDGTCVITPVTQGSKLIVKLKFEYTQTRLDNFGDPVTLPAGNSAQSSVFSRNESSLYEVGGKS
ncbi:MAG: hypothetical protein ACI9N1_003266 [Flavobacteriales bacterium]|jgi:hypothetical protein